MAYLPRNKFFALTILSIVSGCGITTDTSEGEDALKCLWVGRVIESDVRKQKIAMHWVQTSNNRFIQWMENKYNCNSSINNMESCVENRTKLENKIGKIAINSDKSINVAKIREWAESDYCQQLMGIRK